MYRGSHVFLLNYQEDAKNKCLTLLTDCLSLFYFSLAKLLVQTNYFSFHFFAKESEHYSISTISALHNGNRKQNVFRHNLSNCRTAFISSDHKSACVPRVCA